MSIPSPSLQDFQIVRDMSLRLEEFRVDADRTPGGQTVAAELAGLLDRLQRSGLLERMELAALERQLRTQKGAAAAPDALRTQIAQLRAQLESEAAGRKKRRAAPSDYADRCELESRGQLRIC